MWHCISGCDSHLDVDVALGVLDFTLLFFLPFLSSLYQNKATSLSFVVLYANNSKYNKRQDNLIVVFENY